MTRVGWAVLAVILLIAGVFASLLSFGDGAPGRRAAFRAAVEPAAVVEAGAPALLVPVAGVRRDRIVDGWGDARGEGRQHHGTDIMAAGGTPVLAAAAGTVEKLYESRLGGITLYQRSVDRRWTFYYAHLQGYAPGVHEGQAVRAGEVLGFVGDTGDAAPGNTHLHFSTTRLRPDQRWWEGEDVNAYPMLRGR